MFITPFADRSVFCPVILTLHSVELLCISAGTIHNGMAVDSWLQVKIMRMHIARLLYLHDAVISQSLLSGNKLARLSAPLRPAGCLADN